MEHYKNKYIPILIDEILKPVFDEIQATAQAEQPLPSLPTRPPPPIPAASSTLKAISDVENNFLQNFFDNENSKYDFGITKILKGEIFDITATSTNNKLGELKSQQSHYKYETSLQDISGELNFIKHNTQDDKSEKREIRLNFIDNCIELDNGNPNGPFNILFKYLTAYINGFNTIGIANEQFLVKNSGGNIFKLYAELLHLIFEDRTDEIEVEFRNMEAEPLPEKLFKDIQKIMIDMFNKSFSPDSEKYSIYNSLRDNIRKIRLQNYSDIDSYIIQKSVAGETNPEKRAPAKEDEEALVTKYKKKILNLLTDGISRLLNNRDTDLAQQNMIEKINNNIESIKSIKSINYIFQQISDTLTFGIENIIAIKKNSRTPRQIETRIKSNCNNTLKEINIIIDNYNKTVRKPNIDQDSEVLPYETAGFILFRIKSYNKIIGFNTEDTKINYNIKELLIKLELINELNKKIVENISNSKYDYLPSYNNLDENVKENENIPWPLYPQVFQNNFLKINIDNSQDITKKILGHLFLKSLQYEKELMRISTDTNSKKLLKSNNFNDNIKRLHTIFEKININININSPAPALTGAPTGADAVPVTVDPNTFTNLSSLLNSNSLIDAMIKALIAFNTERLTKLIDYNENYNNNGEINGKMVKTLLGQTGHGIIAAYNKMIQNIDTHITSDYVRQHFKNQLLNFIAIKDEIK